MSGRKAAFLDRDGVINVDRSHVGKIEDFEFLPGALDASRLIADAGYSLVVVTNQAGIAKGYYSMAAFEQLTAWMKDQFTNAGAPLTDVYFCPHHPQGSIAEFRKICACRKPAPGLILRAARDHDIDLRSSFLVGDKLSDLEAGRVAGVGRSFLLADVSPHPSPGFATTLRSLQEVADLIRISG